MALQLDVGSLTPEQKLAFLDEVSNRSLLSKEKSDALYLVIDDDIFFLLALMAGDEVRFPTQRDLRQIYLAVSRTGASSE